MTTSFFFLAIGLLFFEGLHSLGILRWSSDGRHEQPAK